MQHLATGSAIALTSLAAKVMGTRRFAPSQLPVGGLERQGQEALLAEEWTSCCGQLGVPADITKRWWNVIVDKYNEPQRAYHTVNHLYELFYQYYRVVGTYNFCFEDDMVEALGHAEAQMMAVMAGVAAPSSPPPAPTPSLFAPSSVPSEGSSSAPTVAAAGGPKVGQYLSAPFCSPTAVALTIFFHDVIYDPKAASGVNEESSALLFERFCRDCEVVSSAHKLAVHEAQLRAKALAMAHSEVSLEEAEAVRQEKIAAEGARRRDIEMLGNGAGLSKAQQQAFEEGMKQRTQQLKDSAIARRLERPERLAQRTEAVYHALQRSTPLPSGAGGAGAGSRGTAVIPPAVEEEVMLLIRATKNHTATGATHRMEQVRHPAMVAVEEHSDLILWQRKQLIEKQLASGAAADGGANTSGSSGILPLSRVALFPPHQTHCIGFNPSAETDLGIFLDMDLSIVGVGDRSRYDSYGDQIRHEYIHYPAKDYRAGRTAILSRFLTHTEASSPQPLYKTPLYRYWCNANAKANLSREIGVLAVPELKARTITIGDVPKVAEFVRLNFGSGGGGGSLASTQMPPPPPLSSTASGGATASAAAPASGNLLLSSAAVSFFKLSEADMGYLAAFNFDFCLMLRIEDEAEMMTFLEHERTNGRGVVGAAATPDLATRVQEVSRTAPPIAAVVFTSLSADDRVKGATQRGSQDFCGPHMIIHSIVVHKYYRHRGVGSKLLRELMNRAKVASISPPTRLSVLCPEVPAPIGSGADGNGATTTNTTSAAVNRCAEQVVQSFFEKNGFVRVGTQSVQVSGGGGGILGFGPSSSANAAGQGNRSNLNLVEMSMPLN